MRTIPAKLIVFIVSAMLCSACSWFSEKPATQADTLSTQIARSYLKALDSVVRSDHQLQEGFQRQVSEGVEGYLSRHAQELGYEYTITAMDRRNNTQESYTFSKNAAGYFDLMVPINFKAQHKQQQASSGTQSTEPMEEAAFILVAEGTPTTIPLRELTGIMRQSFQQNSATGEQGIINVLGGSFGSVGSEADLLATLGKSFDPVNEAELIGVASGGGNQVDQLAILQWAFDTQTEIMRSIRFGYPNSGASASNYAGLGFITTATPASPTPGGYQSYPGSSNGTGGDVYGAGATGGDINSSGGGEWIYFDSPIARSTKTVGSRGPFSQNTFGQMTCKEFNRMLDRGVYDGFTYHKNWGGATRLNYFNIQIQYHVFKRTNADGTVEYRMTDGHLITDLTADYDVHLMQWQPVSASCQSEANGMNNYIRTHENKHVMDITSILQTLSAELPGYLREETTSNPQAFMLRKIDELVMRCQNDWEDVRANLDLFERLDKCKCLY